MNRWKKMIIILVVALLALPLYATNVLADVDLEYKYEERGAWGITYENVKVNGIDVSELLGDGEPYQDGKSICFPQADGTIKKLDINTYNNEKGQGNITDLNDFTYNADTKTVSVEVSWGKNADWHVDDVVFSASSGKKNWLGSWKTTEENIISPQRVATTAGYATTTDSSTSYKYEEDGYENVKITDIDVTDLVDSAATKPPFIFDGAKSIYFPQSDGSVKRLDFNTYNNEKGMGDITEVNGFEYDPVSRTVSVRVSWQYFDDWHVDDIITSGTHEQDYGYKEYKEIIPSQKISTESTTQFSNGLKEMDRYQDGSNAVYVVHVQADFLEGCEPGNNSEGQVIFRNDEEDVFYTLTFKAFGTATQDSVDVINIEKQPDGSYMIKVQYYQGLQDQDMEIETSLEKYSSDGPPFEKLQPTKEEEEQWGRPFEDTFTTVPKPEPKKDDPWTDSNTTNGEGTGSYENPYLITAKNLGDVCVITYEELPFHFFLGNTSDSQPGTYLVDLDIAKKQVKFKLISYDLRVGFVPEHSDDNPTPDDYVIQVGVEAVNLVTYGITKETTPAYLITQISNNAGVPTVVNLRNGFNSVASAVGGMQQHEAAFVFVQRNRNTIGSDNWQTDIVYQFAEDVPSEQAGWLEKAATRLLKFLGDMFLKVVKTFLGEDLTIDRIIFNEYEPTVIDLEGQRGILGDGNVQSLIDTVYKAFVAFAITVYSTILLYIAIKVLLVTGTHEQGKYKNYITDWLVGLALLFVAPMVFRYIPTLSNAIIQTLGSSRQVLYTYYNNVKELDSEKYGVQGEDPRSIRIEELIGLREEKYKELEAQKLTAEDIRQELDKMLKVLQGIIDSHGGNGSTNQSLARIRNLVIDNADLWSGITDKNELDTAWRNAMFQCTSILRADPAITDGMQKELLTRLSSFLNTVIGIRSLEGEIADITARIEAPDLMGEMRSLAGKTDRFIYAIVWWICIFQMIGVLCLYYRRIIMMAMLIMIYPLVVITYPLDKIKDGKAQSLSIWYKEFTVNILVQIVHVVVYMVLIQTGVKLYQDNPKNWLFFLLSILFLFPAERMMRGMFGLSGSTMGNLKFSALSAVGGTAALVGATKDAARAVNRKAGITKRGKEEKAKAEKAKQKEKANRDKRDAYLKNRADEKARLREKNRDYRKRNAAYVGRMRRATYAVANTTSKARDVAYKVGNQGRKLKGKWRRLQDSDLAKFAKGTWKVARGTAGIAFGSASFVTSAGRQGLGTGIYTGLEQGRIVGGFQSYGKLPKQAKDYRIHTNGSTQNASAAATKASSTAGPTAGAGTTTSTTKATRTPKPGTGKVTKRIAKGLKEKKKTETVRIEDEKK